MSHQPLLLCHDCDLVIANSPATAGNRVCCPRCQALLYEVRSDSVNRVLALSLTGLLLSIPANTLPIMSLQIIGSNSSNTMVNGVVQLISQGYWWMGLLVLLCSVVLPVTELLILFVLGLSIKLDRWRQLSIGLLKWQGKISEWGMLEVYMLGIIVAFVKMKDLGELHAGMGLAAFIG
ncbi:MAG: paraquat-inducible protein A, partial [Immundisolibacteraceae bacterium]|nr:paraquat-inducible protein A [Immundisolibacteraceae bacterium]